MAEGGRGLLFKEFTTGLCENMLNQYTFPPINSADSVAGVIIPRDTVGCVGCYSSLREFYRWLQLSDDRHRDCPSDDSMMSIGKGVL